MHRSVLISCVGVHVAVHGCSTLSTEQYDQTPSAEHLFIVLSTLKEFNSTSICTGMVMQKSILSRIR